MSKNELIAKIEALNEWEALMEEAKSEAEAIRDSIKAEMMEREVEELTAGQYIIRWTGLSQILCKHRNAVQIEQNLFKAEVAQAAAALFSK